MDGLSQVFAQGFNGTGSPQLDSWIAIGRDGIVTAYTGKCDFGQGLYTAQMQLVAEEVGVPLNRVRLVQCDTSMTPDQGTTSGQQSHPTNFNHSNLALAGATAREALVRLAATRLGAPAADLDRERWSRRGEGQSLTKRGVRRSDRWRAIQSAARSSGQAEAPVRVDRSRYRRSACRHARHGDGPIRVRAQRQSARHASWPCRAATEVGATVGSVDESSIRELPGIVKVVVKGNFIGVVAQKPWQAMQGAERLKVTWTPGTPLSPHADLYSALRKQPARDTLLVDSGDVDAKLTAASTVLKATYHHPYQMHASMGSSCAVADVQGDKATIWSATQSAFPTRNTSAMLLGLKQENVRVIYVRGAGCYGINGADTVSYDAALLSQAVGRPVRVQLSRKDEMAWENYGNAFVIDQRVALDAQRRHQRVGLRSVVGGARRPSWLQHSWQRRHRVPRRLEPCAIRAAHAGSGAEHATRQRVEHGAVVHRRARPRFSQRRGRHSKRASPLAPRPVAVLHRAAACAGAPAEHVRARVLHGRSGCARESRSRSSTG